MSRILLYCLLGLVSVGLSAAENSESKSESKSDKSKTDIEDILDNMGYPELQVVPRATDRLAMEAKGENNSGWLFEHWTIELSGLATMTVGLTGSSHVRNGLNANDQADSKTINTATTAVGLGWLVGGILLGAEHPYQSGQNTVSKYPGKDERSTLLRERMAEEALERPAKIVRVLQYFSVATNVAMTGLSLVYANNSGRITAGVGLTLAFLPVLFQDHSIDVYEKQMDYKKKIYTPIKSVSFSYDPYHKTMTPLPTLSWAF